MKIQYATGYKRITFPLTDGSLGDMIYFHLFRNPGLVIDIGQAQEYDGSDSGARPDEAVSWGKIRGSTNSVKVHCDATIAFPILVAQTFALRVKLENYKRSGRSKFQLKLTSENTK